MLLRKNYLIDQGSIEVLVLEVGVGPVLWCGSVHLM